MSRAPLLRFERTLTLGVIVALALHSAGALIWAGAASERLDQIERRLDDQTALATPVAERLARLEEHAVHTRESLARIEDRLDAPRPGSEPAYRNY
jgi:type II secretory pathway component PulM